jgi:excisionase family DNA binding protein
MAAQDHISTGSRDDRITRGEIATVERRTIAPRLLRLKDAAEYLSMGTKALRHLINSKKLPYVQLGLNSPFLIDVRDLDKFIERHKVNEQA